MRLRVVGRVPHRRYLPGTLDPAGSGPASWEAPAEVDTHGWWQPAAHEIGAAAGSTRQIVRNLLVAHGTECGDRDRWTVPGAGELLQVGDAEDYSHGPGGVRVPLVVHLSRTPEATMVDRCEIRERDSWADETQQPGPVAHQYDESDLIPCRIEVDARQPRTAVVGGETVTLTTLTVAVPLEVCPVENEVITIMSARIDQGLVGRRYDVKVADAETYALERRVLVVEHL